MPDGEPGLLAVRGPVGCRYLTDPRQREYVRRGWNITGDTYVRDPDGYFRYVARADDMIVSAGYNIAGPEVEDALLRHPDVVETAVVGRPDEARGQVVVAYAVLREGARKDAEALRAFLKSEPRRTNALASSSSWTRCPRWRPGATIGCVRTLRRRAGEPVAGRAGQGGQSFTRCSS